VCSVRFDEKGIVIEGVIEGDDEKW